MPSLGGNHINTESNRHLSSELGDLCDRARALAYRQWHWYGGTVSKLFIVTRDLMSCFTEWRRECSVPMHMNADGKPVA